MTRKEFARLRSLDTAGLYEEVLNGNAYDVAATKGNYPPALLPCVPSPENIIQWIDDAHSDAISRASSAKQELRIIRNCEGRYPQYCGQSEFYKYHSVRIRFLEERTESEAAAQSDPTGEMLRLIQWAGTTDEFKAFASGLDIEPETFRPHITMSRDPIYATLHKIVLRPTLRKFADFIVSAYRSNQIRAASQLNA